MRRFELAAVTFLHGAVACGTVWGFDDPIPVGAGSSGTSGSDAGPVVETPVAPNDPTRTCVPVPPPNWQGPLIIFEGTGSPPPVLPECLTSYRLVVDGNTKLVAPDAACECKCSAEEHADCKATVAWKEKDCGATCKDVAESTVTTTCGQSPQCERGQIKETTYMPGSCESQTVAKNIAPPTWAARGRICTATEQSQSQGGCPSGRVATPTTELPFAVNTYCIAKDGDDVCPAIYPQKRSFYQAFTDSRDCDCACGTPTGGTCTGSVTTSDMAGCTAGPKVITPLECNETKKGFAVFNADIHPGGCAPEAHPKGNATGTTPTTICCTR